LLKRKKKKVKNMEISIAIFLAGAAGALCKDIFKDNEIEMPHWNGGKLGLGFLGGMMIGGASSIYTDGSLLAAFTAGFTGVAMLQSILDGKKPDDSIKSKKEKEEKKLVNEDIEDIIYRIAKEEGIDPALAVRVARAESGLNPTARCVNGPNSIDRGLYQINSKYHPEVTDKEADDPVFATHFFCQAVKDGNLSWWNASKKNWDLTE